jgi:hypothetical protein
MPEAAIAMAEDSPGRGPPGRWRVRATVVRLAAVPCGPAIDWAAMGQPVCVEIPIRAPLDTAPPHVRLLAGGTE